jgi:hypothetical protein
VTAGGDARTLACPGCGWDASECGGYWRCFRCLDVVTQGNIPIEYGDERLGVSGTDDPVEGRVERAVR